MKTWMIMVASKIKISRVTKQMSYALRHLTVQSARQNFDTSTMQGATEVKRDLWGFVLSICVKKTFKMNCFSV